MATDALASYPCWLMVREREQPLFSCFFPNNKITFHKEPLEMLFLPDFYVSKLYMLIFDIVLELMGCHKLIGNDVELLMLSWINPFRATPQWEKGYLYETRS